MDIGGRLLDTKYIPKNNGEDKESSFRRINDFYFNKVIKCPVNFTNDPVEYSTKFLE